jgi:hypothetical protein
MSALQEAIHYSFIKFCTYCFSLWYEFFVHYTFAQILVFLLQTDWLWNKILWQLSVHFLHPWHIKKTDFTKVITRTLSKINKLNLVCAWIMVDTTQWVGQKIALILLFKKLVLKLMDCTVCWCYLEEMAITEVKWHELPVVCMYFPQFIYVFILYLGKPQKQLSSTGK